MSFVCVTTLLSDKDDLMMIDASSTCTVFCKVICEKAVLWVGLNKEIVLLCMSHLKAHAIIMVHYGNSGYKSVMGVKGFGRK